MASIKIVLYKSKKLKNGEHPLMLRVTENRKSRYISLGQSCRPAWWDSKKNEPNRKHPNKIPLKVFLAKKLEEAERMVYENEIDGKQVTPEKIIETISHKATGNSFVQFAKKVIQELKDENRLGTASSYNDALNALIRYRQEVSFKGLDYKFLEALESNLRKGGCKDSGIRIYMASIRAIYNRAIKRGIIRNSQSPFDVYKVSKLKSKPEKRALTKEQIRLIAKAEIEEGSKMHLARQYFMFMYYARGMNFKDMSELRKEQVQEGVLKYTRSKTGQAFHFKLLPQAMAIIDGFEADTQDSPYIFPILNNFHDTPDRVSNRQHKIGRMINKEMRQLALELGIKQNVTTYTARHSYATVLKRSGVSTSVISEGMGHQSEQITKSYLDSFESHVLEDADQHLL